MSEMSSIADDNDIASVTPSKDNISTTMRTSTNTTVVEERISSSQTSRRASQKSRREENRLTQNSFDGVDVELVNEFI